MAESVYIIMPVGSDPLFLARKAALILGIERSGREPVFPAYVAEQPKFSLESFREHILGARAVIADLSLERPSCYYELGVAETLRKDVILVAQDGTPIHQCAGRGAVQYYRDLADLTMIVENALRCPTAT